eukprot:UN10273
MMSTLSPVDTLVIIQQLFNMGLNGQLVDYTTLLNMVHNKGNNNNNNTNMMGGNDSDIRSNIQKKLTLPASMIYFIFEHITPTNAYSLTQSVITKQQHDQDSNNNINTNNIPLQLTSQTTLLDILDIFLQHYHLDYDYGYLQKQQ